MKILFISHYPNPIPAAVWTRISFFGKFLKDKGNEVIINGAFSIKTLNKFGFTNWSGLKLYNITPIIMLSNTFSLIFNILSSVISSFFMIIFIRPNAIVISVSKGDTALGVCFVALALRKKIIIDYRDEWEDYKINNAKTENFRKLCKSLKQQMTKFYLRCNHVITVTEPIVQKLSNRGIKNVKLIPNGADIKIFKPDDKMKLRRVMGYDKHDFIFVYSGGIAGYYRLDLVVRSIGNLIKKNQNVKLVLVGRGSYLKELKNLIKKEGLEKNIHYLGEVFEKKELAKILSASDVGIVPFDSNPLWKNALPSKALEYFACGLPVVATVFEDSVLGKMISENQIGLISVPENVEALTNVLEQIINDQEFVNKVQDRACKLIHEQFDRNKIALDFLKLLEGIVYAKN